MLFKQTECPRKHVWKESFGARVSCKLCEGLIKDLTPIREPRAPRSAAPAGAHRLPGQPRPSPGSGLEPAEPRWHCPTPHSASAPRTPLERFRAAGCHGSGLQRSRAALQHCEAPGASPVGTAPSGLQDTPAPVLMQWAQEPQGSILSPTLFRWLSDHRPEQHFLLLGHICSRLSFKFCFLLSVNSYL